MAEFKERPDYGQSATGSGREKHCFAINGKPAGLVMMDSDGIEYLMWITTAGKLTIGTRAQFEAQSGGTVVGSQS